MQLFRPQPACENCKQGISKAAFVSCNRALVSELKCLLKVFKCTVTELAGLKRIGSACQPASVDLSTFGKQLQPWGALWHCMCCRPPQDLLFFWGVSFALVSVAFLGSRVTAPRVPGGGLSSSRGRPVPARHHWGRPESAVVLCHRTKPCPED